MGFKGITFNRGIPEFRNTNYLINNELGNIKAISPENSDISKSVKMAIFRTSFANIDYDSMTEEKQGMLKEARDKCLKLINFDDFKTARNNQGDGTRKRKGEGKRFNEYTSDPQLRWDLVDLMGEYSYEMLDQGLAIFKFPEYKGGTIVLEKMYKKDKPEYGRATKIINMSIEEFERIIKKKDLNKNHEELVTKI